jgi:hypothetical protein
MQTVEQALLNEDPEKIARIALKVFFFIMSEWDVSMKEQIVLLGNPSESTFYNWKKGKATALSLDTLKRISYIVGIYKSLRILFSDREHANSWPKKPNTAFNKRSALEFMLEGSISSLRDMRRHIDAQI